MKKVLTVFLLLSASFYIHAQKDFQRASYKALGAITLEDNSMFIEEAFNQGMGSIQYISTAWLNRNHQVDYSFTQEIPITDKRHQLSYTLNYFQRHGYTSHGFGDIAIGYRYQLMDEDDWAMVIPRFSLILPTGNAQLQFGNGAVGFQANIAVTKRLSRKVVTHYNVGCTELIRSDLYSSGLDGGKLLCQKNLFQKNIGTSIVWYPVPYVNGLLEYVAFYEQQIEETTELTNVGKHIINPALRVSIMSGNMQIVPGIGAPIVRDDRWRSNGILFYLSFEMNYQ